MQTANPTFVRKIENDKQACKSALKGRMACQYFLTLPPNVSCSIFFLTILNLYSFLRVTGKVLQSYKTKCQSTVLCILSLLDRIQKTRHQITPISMRLETLRCASSSHFFQLPKPVTRQQGHTRTAAYGR
jgi:hypothetical protein